MRNRFDQQLEKLNVELVTMGALCEDALTYAIRALFDRESDMAERAEDAEKQIDQMERDIESICMRLLLQQQPVARDLRVISSALKMIGDMERIGDQAADIADLSQFIDKSAVGEPINIGKMAEKTVTMVTESVDAFVKNDLELCRKVINDDDYVDDAFNEIKEHLAEGIISKKIDAKTGLDILMAAKYFERIGDHAVNIAEWVEYSITGCHRSNEHQISLGV